jgi:hypothetical protein
VANVLTPKQFQTILDRDRHCYHCGINDDTVVPQHRAGRGMGGSKNRQRLSNVIVFCSAANGLLESDANFAEKGRGFGWKISTYADPTSEPVYDTLSGEWFYLDDAGNRRLRV